MFWWFSGDAQVLRGRPGRRISQFGQQSQAQVWGCVSTFLRLKCLKAAVVVPQWHESKRGHLPTQSVDNLETFSGSGSPQNVNRWEDMNRLTVNLSFSGKLRSQVRRQIQREQAAAEKVIYVTFPICVLNAGPQEASKAFHRFFVLQTD